jgi:hypothetical protein
VRKSAGSTDITWRALAENDNWTQVLQTIPTVNDLTSVPRAQARSGSHAPTPEPVPIQADDKASDAERERIRIRNTKARARWCRQEKARKTKEIEFESQLEKTTRSVKRALAARELPQTIQDDLQYCLELLNATEGAKFDWDLSIYETLEGTYTDAQSIEDTVYTQTSTLNVRPEESDAESSDTAGEDENMVDVEGYYPNPCIREGRFFLVKYSTHIIHS